MDAAKLAASPKSAGQRPVYTPEQLLQFMSAGVFSRDEVRQMVREAMGITKPPQQNVQHAVVTTTPNTPRRKAHIAKLKLAPAASPAASPATAKSTRKRKSPEEADLRDVVKNTVRRRFFAECCNLDSKLWVHSKKSDKAYMHRLLFDRACVDVLDLLHKEQPGRLRKLSDGELKKPIRWQVARDRNNWAGKKPKRMPFHGEILPFDFEAVYAEIEEALASATDLTETSRRKVQRTLIPSQQEVQNRLIKSELEQLQELKINEPSNNEPSNSKGNIQMCITCRVNVWTGAVEECPKFMQLANPFETNWAQPNAQPYCAKCWGQEETMMRKMGQEHCAVGPKRKKLDEAVHVAQANAVAAAIANATVPPEPKTKKKGENKKTKKTKKKGTKQKKNKGAKPKKTLGGVRTDAPAPEPKHVAPALKWWQVCA